MATSSTFLFEEQFLCSVCLDVFTEPITTPCGHNFCMACIQRYWDSSDICKCPMCKKEFSSRPDLHINTLISELAVQFKMSVQVKASVPEQCPSEVAEVPCDFCTGVTVEAHKSCLVCLTSFCEMHLEPHQRLPVFKSHQLIDPVGNLADRMCKKHNRLTELYCRSDQAFICVLCIKTDHKNHDIVPLEEEYEAKVAKLDETVANVQEMIHTRSQKITEMESSVVESKREAEKEISDSLQVFTDLIRSIEKSQAELIEVIEERHKMTKEKAEGFIKDMEMEIIELERRHRELEQLLHSEDRHHFLQSFSSLSKPLNKDWKNFVVDSDLSVETVRRAVSQLQESLGREMEQLPDIKLKRIRKYAVDLTLDPDTAHCELILSQDGKQVRHGDANQNLPDNPKRFEKFVDVLAKEGFTTGRFYYEVQVKGKMEWTLGVVRESIDRKEDSGLTTKNGFWVIGLDEGSYLAYDKPSVKLSLKEKPQKVGVFVDYKKGKVSFYNVEAKSEIYSFSNCYFKEKLYPYFCPQYYLNGTNSAPLIITLVNHPD